MTKRAWPLYGAACLLTCMGFTCGEDEGVYTNDAIVINQTEDDITLVIRRPTVSCVEVFPDDIGDLTQSDFMAPETLTCDHRAVSLLPDSFGINCHTTLFWLEVGDFSGIVRWSGLDRIMIPERIELGHESRALFLEGRDGKLEVTVGAEIESYPAPREGPPVLRPDTLDESTEDDGEYY